MSFLPASRRKFLHWEELVPWHGDRTGLQDHMELMTEGRGHSCVVTPLADLGSNVVGCSSWTEHRQEGRVICLAS